MSKLDSKQALRVIIADDEPIILMTLTSILEEHNFEVVGSASDGLEALELCRNNPVDVVLMDIQMPVLDGLTAAQIIHEENLAETVIMVTAYDEHEYVDKAGELGVAGYLIKPITGKALVPCINVALARSKEMVRLRNETIKAKDALETRKLIERVKGQIMAQKKMTEMQAYEYLRLLSKERKVSMHKICEALVRSL